MKKIIIITGIIVLGLFSSCQDSIDDFLEVENKSSLDESVIFSTLDLAKGAVDGIKIPFTDTNSYRGRFIPYYGLNTDCEWLNASETVGDKSDLCVYDAKPNNPQMNTINSKTGAPDNVWSSMYTGIERANICIRGLRTYGKPAPGNELGYLLGEALTLRAIYYADLLKAWGDVPMRFVPINNETLYLPKTNRDIIYKQLIADLAEAAELVPWPNGSEATKSVERVNKAFVKGLRARLALAASGFQQYPDGVRRSNDPELSVANMYALALKECRDVIGSGKAHLQTTITNPKAKSAFEQFWRSYNEDVITAGGESLWEIPFAEGRGRVLYTFSVKHAAADQFQKSGKVGGSAGPLPNVFYDYDVDDTRRDVTCVPYGYGNPAAGIAKQELGKLNNWSFGKYRYEWMIRIPTAASDDGVNKIYLRYAEVLLMAAETANEMEGPAAAAPYLKEIRKRAFPLSVQATKVDAYVNALTSKSAMFDAIVDEQKFEFTGEMERKQALIRWNLLEKKLKNAKDRMTDLAARTSSYSDVATSLYFKYKADGLTLDIYGLNHGETTAPGAGYTVYAWNTLDVTKINSLYRLDPNTRQFWPIWKLYIDGSNDMLKNDYGY